MQHKSPYIILTARPMVWRLRFVYDDIYSLASGETAYEDHRNTQVNSNRQVMMDDDRPIFNYYLSIAISDLTGLLARRLDPMLRITLPDGTLIENNGIVESANDVEFYMVMDQNHESLLLSSMHRYCTDFLVKRVLEQWYKREGLSKQAKADIIKVLEFRRKPVRRPIRNML